MKKQIEIKIIRQRTASINVLSSQNELKKMNKHAWAPFML